jgi:hypothetical protein
MCNTLDEKMARIIQDGAGPSEKIKKYQEALETYYPTSAAGGLAPTHNYTPAIPTPIHEHLRGNSKNDNNSVKRKYAQEEDSNSTHSSSKSSHTSDRDASEYSDEPARNKAKTRRGGNVNKPNNKGRVKRKYEEEEEEDASSNSQDQSSTKSSYTSKSDNNASSDSSEEASSGKAKTRGRKKQACLCRPWETYHGESESSSDYSADSNGNSIASNENSGASENSTEEDPAEPDNSTKPPYEDASQEVNLKSNTSRLPDVDFYLRYYQKQAGLLEDDTVPETRTTNFGTGWCKGKRYY